MFKFRNKQKEPSLLEISADVHPMIDIARNPDLGKQLNMLELDEQDLAVAKVLQPIIEKRIDELLDGLFETILHNPILVQNIESNSTPDRLKGKIRSHIIEMFAGKVDQAYFEKRHRACRTDRICCFRWGTGIDRNEPFTSWC